MVRVVVKERTDGAGDENVLPSPPPTQLNPPPVVAIVPALEFAASESVVSPFVDRVGAVDFTPVIGTWLS